MTALAVYTTIYPGVERYLADWSASLRRQTDRDFSLWIGLDVLDAETVQSAMGGDLDAVWVCSRDGDTPGSLRQRALAAVVEDHSAVLLVDSDDILHATRVETARRGLRAHDLIACPLRLVDERGVSLEETFTLPPGVAADAVFPRTNAFGLSNTAWRADLLRRCLPIPAEAMLVDWFLATRAWLVGARLAFGERAEMDYRQYGANIARVRAPFSERQVVEDTARVRAHYRLVRGSDLSGADPARLATLEAAARDVELFSERVVRRPATLTRYLRALNESRTTALWWAWVADPSLRRFWTSEEGAT